MIKIICVGKIKEKYLQDAINEYCKRLQKYTNLEIIEIQDEDLGNEEVSLKKEAEKIEKHLNIKDYIITLEIEGKEMSSVELAKTIDKIYLQNSNITFIIGGSFGIAKFIKEKSNLKLSFSRLTFPHQLFRVMLLEQIYRGFKINHKESYHK